MSRRDEKKQKKLTKACSGSTESDTKACGSKDTKACSGSRKCK